MVTGLVSWLLATDVRPYCKLVPEFRRPAIAGACAIAALVYPTVTNWQTAWNIYHSWSNATAFVQAFRRVAADDPSRPIFVSNASNAFYVARYYTREGHDWQHWSEWGLPLGSPPVPRSRWISYELAQLDKKKLGVIVLFYQTTLYAPSLPSGMLLTPLGNQGRENLLKVAGGNVS